MVYSVCGEDIVVVIVTVKVIMLRSGIQWLAERQLFCSLLNAVAT